MTNYIIKNNASKNRPPIFSIKEFAESKGTSFRALNLKSKGKNKLPLPVVTVGKKNYYIKSELEQWFIDVEKQNEA